MAAAHYTGWPDGSPDECLLAQTSWGTPHDQLDAYLSAWVATLDESDRVAYGNPPDDAIWIPRLSSTAATRMTPQLLQEDRSGFQG
jgi:hypothetical protein